MSGATKDMPETHGFVDIRVYPADLLKLSDRGVEIPVTYMDSWNDGFGARGWKLDATINDPVIIASTRETGQCIPTSVFVHDVLDHFLSGFGVSGHRSEAMALRQLSLRTGSDPSSDYLQLINEDILCGMVNGETMSDFLPESLQISLPVSRQARAAQDAVVDHHAEEVLPGSAQIECLAGIHGQEKLAEMLLQHFHEMGRDGEQHAVASWKLAGLEHELQTETGLALQKLLVIIDSDAENDKPGKLHGKLVINQNFVAFDSLQGHCPVVFIMPGS